MNLNLNPPLWRIIQKKNFTNLIKLVNFLELDEKQKKNLSLNANFPLNLPLRLAEKIEKNNIEDPLFRQFVPIIEEEVVNELFVKDPLKEESFKKTPKLLHKYHGRVLLVSTSSCAMNCRYCFRRHFDYEISSKSFDEEFAYISNDSTIHEVILSGGDPLSLSNRVLKDILNQLSAIPHVQKIRFHTRFPVGIPERIDDEFVEIIKQLSLQTIVVLHINHPREIDSFFFEYVRKLQKEGAILLNQSVLLKGVNDEFSILYELFHTLTNHGIIPYYLHQLDHVEGASHFKVPEEKGIDLIRRLRASLPGYAVPRYDREEPDELHKTIIL